MEEDNAGDGTPETIRKFTYFFTTRKYRENLDNFNRTYITLQLPSKVKVRALDFGQSHSSSDDGTITVVDIRKLPKE